MSEVHVKLFVCVHACVCVCVCVCNMKISQVAPALQLRKRYDFLIFFLHLTETIH